MRSAGVSTEGLQAKKRQAFNLDLDVDFGSMHLTLP
jgi:hypothetical protein